MSQASGTTLQRAAELERALRSIIRGKDDVVRLALVAILARGHLLIEGVPGLARPRWRMRWPAPSIATSAACSSPATCCPATCSVFPCTSRGRRSASSSSAGPIFTNILLADEINRTTPKTQSALLEAMNERQVTVDGHSHPLPNPFLVIATQNPVEHHGTYPLPESQTGPLPDPRPHGLSRGRQRARDSARAGRRRAPRRVRPVLTAEDVVALQNEVRHGARGGLAD